MGLLMIFMIIFISPVFAADGLFGLPDWGTISIGAILAGILTFLSIRGERNSQIGSVVGTVRGTLMSRDSVDKAVESVLTRLGIPPLLADKIGDIVSLVFWEVPDWVAPQEASLSGMSGPSGVLPSIKVIGAVKAAIVREFADSHPAEVATLLPGLPDKAYLARDNRIRVAERLAKDPRILMVIRTAISEESQKPQIV
jgi:hypothetical protein